MMLGWLLGRLTAAAVGYQPPRDFGELVAWVVGLAALVTAGGYLLRQTRRAFRWVEQIHTLATRELEPSGHAEDDATMKDDLHGIAVTLGHLQRRVDGAARQISANSRRLDQVEADLTAIYDPLHRYGDHKRHDQPQPREDI